MKNLWNIQNVLMVLGLSLIISSCGKSESNGGGGGGQAAVPACQSGYAFNGQNSMCCPNAGATPYGQYGAQCYSPNQQNQNCQGSCQVGMVQTQYGCYPQAQICQNGQQTYNCVPAQCNGGMPYGGGQYPQYYGGGYNGGANTNYYYQNNYRSGSWGPFNYWYGY